jgi:adenylate cyclase
MPVEIERKFLVESDEWRSEVRRRELLRQGYVAGSDLCSVRVRVGAGRAWLGIKSRVNDTTRFEYEYEIPAADANEILDRICPGGQIEKWRHWVPYGHREWEIDEFLGDNAGLVMAELELDSPSETFERPPWLGLEVTADSRYLNTSLALRPWREWRASRGDAA